MRSFFSAVHLILTLPCDESERLISAALDRPLPWAERWALRLHFVSCWSCRRVRKQLNILRRAAAERGDLPTACCPASHSLSPAARARIDQALRDAEQEQR